MNSNGTTTYVLHFTSNFHICANSFSGLIIDPLFVFIHVVSEPFGELATIFDVLSVVSFVASRRNVAGVGLPKL